MRKLLLLIGFGLAVSASAQTSAYQSADSTTSIFLDNAKANVLFNVSDSKFDIGYLHEEAGHWAKQWGLDFTGKPSGNLSTQIFQKGSTPPSLGGSASFGFHGLSNDPDKILTTDCDDRQKKDKDGNIVHKHGCGIIADDWGLIQVTYSRSSFSTSPDGLVAPQKQKFDAFKGLLVYNALVGAKSSSFIFGGAVGIERKNNLDKLTSVTFNTPVVQTTTGSATFEADKQANGYVGAYKKFIGAPIYSDVVFVPGKVPWLSVDAFTRSNAAHNNRSIEGGVGVFIARPNAPTAVLGGISLAWKNGTPSIGVVAGWSF